MLRFLLWHSKNRSMIKKTKKRPKNRQKRRRSKWKKQMGERLRILKSVRLLVIIDWDGIKQRHRKELLLPS